MGRRERSLPAFTLVELLVVIGIIALLISILMPALSKARYQAQEVACMSNVRQQVLAMLMYSSENKGKFPQHIDFGPSYVRSTENKPGQQNIWYLFKGTFIKDPRVLYRPLLTWRGELFESPDDVIGGGGYGGWNTDEAQIFIPYDWFINCTPTYGGIAAANWTYPNNDLPWPRKANELKSDAAVVSHEITETIGGPGPGWNWAHNGYGRTDASLNSRSNPVGYGDGHVEVHQRDDIKPRVRYTIAGAQWTWRY